MPKGRLPKPAHLRQNRTKKYGRATLPPPDESAQNSAKAPTLPNPDKRKWHRLTRAWWRRVWQSPMAGEYLPTDVDGLGRLAILVDEYYKLPDKTVLAEIRLQEARFGLSPVDRSRLQWEVQKGEEAQQKRQKPPKTVGTKSPKDPRGILAVVK